jgi:hypothetical protein
LAVSVSVDENPYKLPLDFLFGMAARKNKKRGFLFVSKILGKHIPVTPITSLLSGALLGIRYMESVHQQEVAGKGKVLNALLNKTGEKEIYESLMSQLFVLPEDTLFIGFAETATALGHSVFDLFENAHYIHTTREKMVGLTSTIEFEEEHSHATEQACYCNHDLLVTGGPIVLVDDEITTGKTALNIIESLHKTYPRREYTVLSLLDWRSEENKQSYRALEKKLNITIHTASLLSGTITVEGNPVEHENDQVYAWSDHSVETEVIFTNLEKYTKNKELADVYEPSINSLGYVNHTPYTGLTGRFHGLSHGDTVKIDEYARTIGEILEQTRSGGNALCLGTGEFMYVPMKIASYMGPGVYSQSTTRSPIHRVDADGYAVRNGSAFQSPDDASITNYFYNIIDKHYEDIYLFLERKTEEIYLAPILEKITQIGAKKVFVVTINN